MKDLGPLHANTGDLVHHELHKSKCVLRPKYVWSF